MNSNPSKILITFSGPIIGVLIFLMIICGHKSLTIPRFYQSASEVGNLGDDPSVFLRVEYGRSADNSFLIIAAPNKDLIGWSFNYQNTGIFSFPSADFNSSAIYCRLDSPNTIIFTISGGDFSDKLGNGGDVFFVKGRSVKHFDLGKNQVRDKFSTVNLWEAVNDLRKTNPDFDGFLTEWLESL